VTHRVCIVRQMSNYEPQVQRVAEALREAGYDVEVLCMRHPDRSRKTVVNGVEITSLPASLNKSAKSTKPAYALKYGWFFLVASVTLAVRHARRRYDVIQIYTMPDFLVFAGFVPKLFGARILAYMNEPTPELFETIYGPSRFVRILERIEQRVLRFADHAITVTERLKQRYVERGADASSITVVLNAVDARDARAGWQPPEDRTTNEFTVLCHGTIESRYGQDTILEAARILRDEGLSDLRVVITGVGSGVEEMCRQIAVDGLEDIVRYEGWVSRSRLNDLLATSQAGIVAQKPSSYSNLVTTYKMVDYWIFDLPVIASRLDATTDLFDSSVIEFYEPGSAVDLARAIRRLYEDPDRRLELAGNAKQALVTSGWDVQRPVLLGVYGRLINEEARPASAVHASTDAITP
jgi:glycosyltransferase involved in cell wall biosynthesis